MNKLIFFLLLLSGILYSQTANDIIDKHIEATGGYNAWNRLNSILIEGKVSIDVSETIDIKVEHRRPYFKRVSFITNGTEQLSEGYDGTNAYTHNELDGKYKLLKEYKPDAFETDFFNYQKKGFKAEFKTIEKVRDQDAFKIKLTKNNLVNYYWFNTQTYQLVKEETETETAYYSDFNKVDGLTFAFRTEATPKGGKEYVVIFEKVVPNAHIPDNRFYFE